MCTFDADAWMVRRLEMEDVRLRAYGLRVLEGLGLRVYGFQGVVSKRG